MVFSEIKTETVVCATFGVFGEDSPEAPRRLGLEFAAVYFPDRICMFRQYVFTKYRCNAVFDIT